MHNLGSPVLQWSLVAACIAALLGSILRLVLPNNAVHHPHTPAWVRGYVCRDAAAAQVVMLALMAAMFAVPSAPTVVWQVGLLVVGSALAAQLLIRRSSESAVEACSHLLAVVAMLYATARHDRHPTHATLPTHAGHAGGHAGPPMLGWVFAVAFVVEALMLVGVALAAPGARPRLAAALLPHVVMDVAMVVMLYAALTAPAGR